MKARISLDGAALAFGFFVRNTRELNEGAVGAVDSAILLAVAKTPTYAKATVLRRKVRRILPFWPGERQTGLRFGSWPQYGKPRYTSKCTCQRKIRDSLR